MSSGTARRVFFSYAAADRARVEEIVRVLEGRGFDVWWDRQIEGGSPYAKVIEAALQASQAVVVAWSKASLDSHWVRDEAEFGRDERRLVPISLDGSAPPLGFRQFQVVDFAAWNGHAAAPETLRLVAALETQPQPDQAASGPAGAAVRERPPPSTPAKLRGVPRRAALIAGAALVPALAAGAWWFGWGSHPAAPPRSIAVLPFDNLSGDPGEDYFSDGLSEELIGALARLSNLEVVASTSSFPFRGSKLGSREIGVQLNVANILAGSVRRSGQTVRVGAQLVEAESGFARWSQSFDRDLKDVLAVQSDIAQQVAGALEVRLAGPDLAALNLGGASNEGAYDHYLRGMHLFDAGGAEAVYRQALAEFDQAIAADGAYAAAHAARARTVLTIAIEYTPPQQLRATYDDAMASAGRAVALAPGLAEAQATLGSVLQNGRLDFAGAKAAFARAYQAGSGRADILTRYGQFMCDIGDFSRGLPAVRRAAVLDPLNPRVFRTLGYALIEQRRFDEGAAAARRVLELNPQAQAAHALIGDALLLEGNPAAAQAEYAREPLSFLRAAGQAIAARRLGDAAGAARAFAELAAAGDDVTLYQQAQVLAQWGEPDRALSALAKARQLGDPGLVLMKVDPMLDPLRGDPRFAQFQRQLGL